MIPNHGPNLEFGLGETADAIRDTTARFAADRDRAAGRRDRRRPTPSRASSGRRWASWACTAITVEEEYGGLGLGYLEHVVAMEEVSPRLGLGGPVATAPTPTSASTRSAAGARDEQKRRYLPKLISGEHVGALAMSEAGSRLGRGLHAAARRASRATAMS